MNSSTSLVGTLLAAIGGFVVVATWDRKGSVPTPTTKIGVTAYGLIVVGLAVFIVGIIK